uniref:Integrase catalytic domain-containing protein n=1 Tax=Tanacetum cinerariifolium TaxID=118510 RepID=A0A6L2MQB8_TANCI|nr:hypothetical protein [Tanacetum cinerariifolium]
MSNTNNNLQTQTSNALHNAIMEAGGKDRPLVLAPGNYIQWKSRIKRYIDTKPNNELIHYCLQNPPYKFKWTEKTIPVSEGSSDSTTEGYMENYKNVSEDIRDQLNAEVEAVQIILIGIDNDIYSIVDACLNACEIWKSIKRSQQAATRNRDKAIVNSPPPIYDQVPSMVAEDDEMSNKKEIDKLMALISLSLKKIYKPTNNNLRTSSNTSRVNRDNSPMINRGNGYDNQRIGNVGGKRENVGTPVVQKSGIQCYNCKEYGNWKHIICTWHNFKRLLQMMLIILDPSLILSHCKKVPHNDNYNVFAVKSKHPKQSKFVNDTYSIEQDEHNVNIDSLDMSYDREHIDQDDDDDLANERDLLASLIEKLKVIPSTSVSRPPLNSNQLADRVMLNNIQGKKQEVEDHHRNFKFSKNKSSITTCNDNMNAKTLNVKFVCVTCGKCVLNDKHDMCVLYYLQGVNSRNKMPMAVPVSTRESKRNVNQSVATPLRRTVASESTNQKPRHTTRKLYEHVSKACSWWYPKFTPLEYKGKPKSQIENVNPNLIDIILFIVDSREMIYSQVLMAQTGSHGTDLYSISLQDTSSHNPICLMAKVTSSQAWLGCRRLSHLNFDTINLLSKNDIVIGLPKLKFVKDHLCSSCTEFLNKTLHAYFASEEIHHQTSVARTPEQNGIVERWNRTLVEAARTMLSTAKVPLYFWAEAIATTCFTQNHSLVILRDEKTPYHIINDRKPSVKFFHIFGSLFYIVIDGENLDKMKEKGDACIFVGYSTQSRAYRVFNKRTRVLVETIHVNFDELPQMASDHVSSDPVPQCPIKALEHDSLSLDPQSQENVPQAAGTVTTSNKLDLLFSLMFDELLKGSTQVVSRSFAVTTADAPNKCQHHHTTPLNTQRTPAPSCQDPTQAPTATSTKNINQAETISKNVQVEDDEFINIFCTPNKTSARIRWRDVYVRTHCELTEPKNIKEAMADSAWIESMQEELHQFDRLDIHQSPCGIFINQAKYAQEILIKHGMTSYDSIGTPMATKHLNVDLSRTPIDQTKYQSMVGALMYLTASRPDIVHATCYYARYQAKPTEKHLTAVKRIFQYLKNTINMELWYPKDTGFELTTFSDSDHAGCLDSRKSTSGGIQFLGGDNSQIMAFTLIKYLCICDSKVAIAITCNPVQHSHTKHIDVRYHFIKEKVEKGIVELFFVRTEYQLADLFIKALSEDRFKYLVR